MYEWYWASTGSVSLSKTFSLSESFDTTGEAEDFYLSDFFDAGYKQAVEYIISTQIFAGTYMTPRISAGTYMTPQIIPMTAR